MKRFLILAMMCLALSALTATAQQEPAPAQTTFRVEVTVDASGQKVANVPQIYMQNKNVTGIQHGIDTENNHVVFNSDENLGDPRLGEYRFPVLEGEEIEVKKVPSIKEYVNSGQLFEPLAFIYKTDKETGRVTRERVAEQIKSDVDKERTLELQELFDKFIPEGVEPDTYDSRAWADWTYFYQQVEEWEKYLETELFQEPLAKTIEKQAQIIDDELRDAIESHQKQANEISLRDAQNVADMMQRITTRENERLKYRDWLKSRLRDIDHFAEDFRKRMDGKLIIIGKQKFLVVKEPQDRPGERFTIPVVTDVVTPHDLLNEDGSLREYRASGDQSKF